MSVYKSYINTLIDNLNLNESQPLELDLILDGGGFKGSFLIGSLLYLYELEKKNYIKINRISGSSIGGILATLYLLERLDEWDNLYKEIVDDFKKTMNLKFVHSVLENFGQKLDENEYKKLNGKLYLNYFDIQKKQEEVIWSFNSNKEVVECLKYTSYLPVITDGNMHYNNKVDGARPYIFETRGPNEKKILYIDLNFIGKIKNFLNTSTDKNGSGRVLKGIIDIHDFFSEGEQTTMCSYVNNWKLKDYGFHRFKELSWVLVIYAVTLLSVIYRYLSPYISNSLIFNHVKNVLKKLAVDVYIHIVFI
jgi:hypothetical protein